mmetsp:Transcript_51562/g.129517  ORF Transcript_51562/g.129517 Transcript_51562/m.129517 type:complete len:108 (+) Transcript_51562:811-1134(+)
MRTKKSDAERTRPSRAPRCEMNTLEQRPDSNDKSKANQLDASKRSDEPQLSIDAIRGDVTALKEQIGAMNKQEEDKVCSTGHRWRDCRRRPDGGLPYPSSQCGIRPS